MKRKTKAKIKPTLSLSRKVGTHRERMFREAFFPDRKSRKPLLVREKPERNQIGWGMLLLWAVLVSVIVFTVFFSDLHSIRAITVSGTRDVSSIAVESYIRDRLFGCRFIVFPRDNYFSIPIASLERETLREFPKLDHISITRRFPNGLSVDVSERDQLLLWCSSGPCFLVGDDGTALEAQFADTEENAPFLTRIVDESGRPVNIGEPLIDSETMRNVLLLKNGFRERLDIGIVSPIFSPSRVSDEIRIVTNEGWELLVNLDIDSEKTIASLRLVLEKEILLEKRQSLRYIDLRTENRAFFAYSDVAPSQDETIAGQGGSAMTNTAASQDTVPSDVDAKKESRKKK
jgi:hypothetical protein